MKPRSLTLRGFGAYAGEHTVPFHELAAMGLFTVTGPTGSGKTTLFDAMAYALYGGLPGERPAAEVRSHHAAPDTVTEVSFEFEVAGQRWRVERTPEQTVLGARKVRRQAAEARLFQWSNGRWQGVETGPRRVDPRVEALLGLTLHQFERVILLPQGKFQQFLLCGTKERRVLLRHLFGTELYERAVDALLARAGALRDQLAAGDESVRHHVANATASTDALHAILGLADASAPALGAAPDVDASEQVPQLRTTLEHLDAIVVARSSALQTLDRETASAQLAAQRSADVASRWQRRATWLQRRVDHAARQAATALDADRAERARQAAPVVVAAAATASTRQRLAAAQRAGDAARGQLARALVAAGLPADGTVDAAALAAHGEALRAAAVDLAEHRTALDALAAVAERLRAIGTGIERIEIAANEAAEEVSSVSTSVDALASDVEQTPLREVAATAAARILRQREGFDDAERRAESALEAARRATALLDEVTTRFISGIAPRLASALAPGEPCPVCGAIEHPQPAAGHPDATVGPSELESAQSAAHAAMVAQGTSVSELHALRLELGDAADRPLAEVRAEAAAAAASLAASRAAAQQVRRHADRLQVLRDSLDRLSAERAAFELERARLDERRDLSQAVVTRLEPVVQRWAAIDVGAGVRALAEAERWSGEVARLEVDVSVAVARDDDASGALDLALVASGLPSAEAAAALALTTADLAALEARVDAWHREAADIEASLQALADDDLPDVAPDASTDIARAERLARELAAARDDLVRMRHHADAASTSLDAATREAAASAGIRAEFQQAETVARTCAGQGPGRIALESWVLATELDRVAAAANVHLTRMSAGRYQLLRTDDAGHAGKQAGLDLAVLDSHTGRQRPTTTLSGGEQFEASLSLALGLADVVGNTAGASAAGFDALFVDEGFGSLDPDALDLAISALDELRDGGRVVGVITHVEALKAALPIGVEVRPRTDGNGSTLRVHSPEASSSRR